MAPPFREGVIGAGFHGETIVAEMEVQLLVRQDFCPAANDLERILRQPRTAGHQKLGLIFRGLDQIGEPASICGHSDGGTCSPSGVVTFHTQP